MIVVYYQHVWKYHGENPYYVHFHINQFLKVASKLLKSSWIFWTRDSNFRIYLNNDDYL
jgi:hypothetical protein